MKKFFNAHRLFLTVGVIGAIGALIQTTLLVFFVEVLHMYPVLGNTLAAEVAILANFSINNFWTFKIYTGRPFLVRLVTFNIGVLGSIAIQALCIWIGTNYIGVRFYLVYMAIGISIGWMSNYFFYTRLVWFRRKEEIL